MLKGLYGRYHRAIATGEYANVIGANIKPTFAGTGYDFDTGEFTELTFLEGNTNLGVDPNYQLAAHRPVHPEFRTGADGIPGR